MNNAFLLNFDVVYDRLLYFWEDMVCLGIVKKQVYVLSVGHVGVQLRCRAFECRSRGRWFSSAGSLLHYSGLLVERL